MEDSLHIAGKSAWQRRQSVRSLERWATLQHEVCRAKKVIIIVQGDDNLEEGSSFLGIVTDYVNTATLEEVRDDSCKVVLKGDKSPGKWFSK